MNCEAGGSCNGGEPSAVYNFAYTDGIPHTSCLQYEAHNLERASECEAIDICRDCHGPPCPADKATCYENCQAITNYTRHYVTAYFGLRGANQMKTELYQNGPISCGIEVTDNFVANYKAGEVYTEFIANPQLNHEISVVGWGKNATTGQEYWIGRNSWGNYWGDYGFFMVPIGDPTTNLGIQTDCTAGIPSFTQKPDTSRKPRAKPTEFIQ